MSTALLPLVLILGGPLPPVEIGPSFDFERCAWAATHVVIATEGTVVDGHLEVLESLDGDVGAGTALDLPALRKYARRSTRRVADWWLGGGVAQKPRYVGTDRMYLFLVRDPAGQWKAAGQWQDLPTSVGWIHQGRFFAAVQIMNPGGSVPVDFGLSETGARALLTSIRKARSAFDAAQELKKSFAISIGLQELLEHPVAHVRHQAAAGLLKLGDPGVAILSAAVSNDAQAAYHVAIFNGYYDVAGHAAMTEVALSVLGRDAAFWKQWAPILGRAWWQPQHASWTRHFEPRPIEARYDRTAAVLQFLTRRKHPDTAALVAQVRAIWNAHPGLDPETASGPARHRQNISKILKRLP